MSFNIDRLVFDSETGDGDPLLSSSPHLRLSYRTIRVRTLVALRR